MKRKMVVLWALISGCLFVLVNAASYFILSDGYGLSGVQDGIVRVGCPFLMVERGGYVHREFISMSAVMGNLLVASITAVFPLGIRYLMKRTAGLKE